MLQPQPLSERGPIPGLSCGTMTFPNGGSLQLTCHMHRHWLLTGTPLWLFFMLSHEEVGTVVTSLCISDIQGTVVALHVPYEVESAPGLLQHLLFWVVCGHCRVLTCVSPCVEPRAINLSRIGPRTGECAGHKDTEAFLYQHHLHFRLVSITLALCGSRRLGSECPVMMHPHQEQQQKQLHWEELLGFCE